MSSVVETIRRSDADLVAVQEALPSQLQALQAALDDYRSVGRGRDPGGAGEHVPILYRHERVELESHRDFWLSANPEEEGSRGWDAENPRICTAAVFAARWSPLRFALFNTHLDHRGSTSRMESAYLILKRMAEIPDLPVVVTGDFNAFPDSPSVGLFRAAGLRDVLEVVGANGDGTFHGFTGQALPGRIDYILCDGRWRVTSAWIERRPAAGRLPSDHFAVGADLTVAET